MHSRAGAARARPGSSWTHCAALGGEDWFQLGDLDLATHVERTRRLAAGETLSQITRDLFAALGVGARVLPMSDDPVRTIIHTPDGPLAFQHYFVRDKCAPKVTGFSFAGSEQASPAPGVLAGAWRDPDLDCIVICPSNPFVSIDPILAVPGIRAAHSGGARAGDCRFAHCRRTGDQGANRQDDAGAGRAPDRAGRGRAL